MRRVKMIAFYLPQFHAIPENDEWWGKGFTDWVNVKKANKLFAGHEQPRIPLNNNYYDLSKAEAIRMQTELAHKYDVYGFCFYHYWFAGGKKLLEKPSEILLANKDIDLPFCFSWANEPWARTWDGRNSSILMPQEYGTEKEWKEHFEYLLPFFKDNRYIKENNCPIFVIYKSSSIKECLAMMNMWNSLAREAGFNGIHFVETLRGKNDETRKLPFSAKVEFEPSITDFNIPFWDLFYRRIRKRLINLVNKVLKTSFPLYKPWTFAYIANRSLNHFSPKGTYAGAFVGWDNTPRKGLSGTIILPPTKDEFKDYLRKKIWITQNKYETNYIFINAWNEWAEGTYLEPDQMNGYLYLESIRDVLNEFNGVEFT